MLKKIKTTQIKQIQKSLFIKFFSTLQTVLMKYVENQLSDEFKF